MEGAALSMVQKRAAATAMATCSVNGKTRRLLRRWTSALCADDDGGDDGGSGEIARDADVAGIGLSQDSLWKLLHRIRPRLIQNWAKE